MSMMQKGVWLDRGELEKVANMQNRRDEDEHHQKCHYGKGHVYIIDFTIAMLKITKTLFYSE